MESKKGFEWRVGKKDKMWFWRLDVTQYSGSPNKWAITYKSCSPKPYLFLLFTSQMFHFLHREVGQSKLCIHTWESGPWRIRAGVIRNKASRMSPDKHWITWGIRFLSRWEWYPHRWGGMWQKYGVRSSKGKGGFLPRSYDQHGMSEPKLLKKQQK